MSPRVRKGRWPMVEPVALPTKETPENIFDNAVEALSRIHTSIEVARLAVMALHPALAANGQRVGPYAVNEISDGIRHIAGELLEQINEFENVRMMQEARHG